MVQSITLYIDPEKGLTLKTLYDICVYAKNNYKELRDMRPLQRVEAGFGFPKKPGDAQTYYKAQLFLGWNRGRSYPSDCRWNLLVPDNWEDELPKHKLFNCSISNKRPNVKWPKIGAWEERMKKYEEECNSFAYYQGDGLVVKKNKIIVTLDCTYTSIPKPMFKALKSALCDLGLSN